MCTVKIKNELKEIVSRRLMQSAYSTFFQNMNGFDFDGYEILTMHRDFVNYGETFEIWISGAFCIEYRFNTIVDCSTEYNDYLEYKHSNDHVCYYTYDEHETFYVTVVKVDVAVKFENSKKAVEFFSGDDFLELKKRQYEITECKPKIETVGEINLYEKNGLYRNEIAEKLRAYVTYVTKRNKNRIY